MLQIKIAAGVLVALLFLGGLFLVARLSEVTISKVEVAGTSVADASLIQRIVEEQISGSYGFVIPKRNTLFVPSGDIARAISSTFPIVKTAKVSHTSLTSISVTVSERTPTALWCKEDTEEVLGSCYSIDETGFIYMVADRSDAYVRYRGGVDTEPVGSVFLSGKFPELHAFVQETAKTLSRTTVSVSVEPNADVTMAFAGGGELKFVMSEDATSTLENIASVFASQKLKGRTDFEYADFRFGNKVYVKFTDN
jgi:hypothetical protein